MKKSLFVFSFILLIAKAGIGQAIIQGTVEEAVTGNSLPGVNVFLAGTTIGASTDQGGYYKITTMAAGPYDLVFSFVGYKKQIRPVDLSSSFSATFDIKLEEKVQKLGEVEIKSSNKEWKKQYKTFFKQFIGKNDFARKVTIENPWVLDFSEQDGVLIATSPKPIKIINNALGYKLYVELVEFKWPRHRDRGGYYILYPKYEPLNPENSKQAHRWKKNRIKSYLGSFPHFLRSLYDENLTGNNFSLHPPWNITPLQEGKTEYELRSIPGISIAVQENAKGFELYRKVDIRFEGSAIYSFNGKKHSLSVYKEGGIIPSSKDHFFFVDKYGSLINPISLQVYRDWADNRMSNSLPTNYSIGD